MQPNKALYLQAQATQASQPHTYHENDSNPTAMSLSTAPQTSLTAAEHAEHAEHTSERVADVDYNQGPMRDLRDRIEMCLSSGRRKKSFYRVSKRWNITLEDSVELMAMFESQQSHAQQPDLDHD